MSDVSIRVRISDQILELWNGESLLETYRVSTSRYGPGEAANSERTPRGAHEIRAMIGAGAPHRAVFRGRRPTGEICTPELARCEPTRDWILSRILWLRGLELGRNRLGQVDTMRRYIYIHGTPHEAEIGTPASLGCIRMTNDDVIDLFGRVVPGTAVDLIA